jgi:hypothetical protein
MTGQYIYTIIIDGSYHIVVMVMQRKHIFFLSAGVFPVYFAFVFADCAFIRMYFFRQY